MNFTFTVFIFLPSRECAIKKFIVPKILFYLKDFHKFNISCFCYVSTLRWPVSNYQLFSDDEELFKLDGRGRGGEGKYDLVRD